MRYALLVLFALGGCGSPGWILPEAEAVQIADEELARRGIGASDRSHTVATSLLTLELDAWDPAMMMGYEYVADPDPELGAGSAYGELDGWEELQAAVDAAVGTDTHVLIIHTWAHETEALCRDQFLGNLKGRLDALGL